MTINIAEAVSDADLDACKALRRLVFIEEQGVSEAEEIDGLDGEALHLLARDGGTPAGTLRIRFPENVAKIERVCVRRENRGRDLGAMLMRHALDIARQRPGITQAKLGAQLSALAFYERLGFRAYGEEFLDARIPHRHMVRDL